MLCTVYKSPIVLLNEILIRGRSLLRSSALNTISTPSKGTTSVFRTAIARGAAGDVDVELEAGRRVAAVAVAIAGAAPVVEEAPRRAGGRRGRGGGDTTGRCWRRSCDGDGGSGAGATYEGVATCHTDVQRRRPMRTPDADVARDRLVHRAATLLRRKLLLLLLLLRLQWRYRLLHPDTGGWGWKRAR